jgi:hypothetical protein
MGLRILIPFDGSAVPIRAVRLAIRQSGAKPAHSVVVLNVRNLARRICQMAPERVAFLECRAGRARRVRSCGQVASTRRGSRRPYDRRIVVLGGIAVTIERLTREGDIDHHQGPSRHRWRAKVAARIGSDQSASTRGCVSDAGQISDFRPLLCRHFTREMQTF